MDFQQALKLCKRCGTASAKGDALRAMYADLIAFHHSFRPAASRPKLYRYLQRYPDDEIGERGHALLEDMGLACEIACAEAER